MSSLMLSTFRLSLCSKLHDSNVFSVHFGRSYIMYFFIERNEYHQFNDEFQQRLLKLSIKIFMYINN